MDTKQIVLEEVTEQQFNELQHFWGKQLRQYEGDIYSRIHNPLIETDYVRLLFSLLDHPQADLLCVNNQGNWIKRHKEDLSSDEVHELAKIAAADRYKKNFLEIKFKRYPKWFKTGHIEFTEYHGRMIGYDLHIGNVLQNEFTINAKHSFTYNYGLWTPEDS